MNQFLDLVASIQEVAQVAPVGDVEEVDHPHRRGMGDEMIGHARSVFAAGVVVVGDDDHIAPPEKWSQFGPCPRVPRPTVVAGGDQALGDGPIDVLLALDHPDGLARVGSEKFREPERQRWDPVEVVGEVTLPIRPSLMKGLATIPFPVADRLVDQRTVRVPVVVNLLNELAIRAWLGRGEVDAGLGGEVLQGFDEAPHPTMLHREVEQVQRLGVLAERLVRDCSKRLKRPLWAAACSGISSAIAAAGHGGPSDGSS